MEIFQWIWPWEIFLVVWISSFRKINPSSLWFTNRGEWFRQNYGSVWIFHCWNGLFGVSKPHRKGKVPYSSCNLCHVLTIIISPQEKWWQRPCTAMNQMMILLVPDSLFSLQSWPKYMRQTLVLVWNSALGEKFNFCFSAVFCQYLQNFQFERKTEH